MYESQSSCAFVIPVTGPGNLFEIYSVNVSTLYNTRVKKHPLFKGDNVQFCVSGRSTGISQPVPALQNSVHGSIRLSLNLPMVGNVMDQRVNNPFCDIQVCQVLLLLFVRATYSRDRALVLARWTDALT